MPWFCFDLATSPENSGTGIFVQPFIELESRLTFGARTPRRKGRDQELTRIANANCKDGDCSAVYTTDRGTVAVQGDQVNRATLAGEAIVEIPAAPAS